jgi:hypothetical protein
MVNEIERLKLFYVLIRMYFGFLFFLFFTFSLVSTFLFLIGLFGLFILYGYLLWLFLLGVGGVLLSFVDDYKWSLFHLTCKKKKQSIYKANFQKWERDNGL